MGKSNNPAKRATQEAELRAKKSRTNKGAGFLKFVLVVVLSLAICGPFFAGLATMPTTPAPATTATAPATPPALTPVITPTAVPATAPATATVPAGQ